MTGQQIRALIVEDDPSWQQILTEILGDCHMEVDLAENYEEAVSIIRSSPHRLAVVDLSLGGPDHRNQDGLRVLESVRRHDPGCASIFLSGFATVELAVSVIQEQGAFTCLRKETFRRADFRKVIHQALAMAPSSGATGDLENDGGYQDKDIKGSAAGEGDFASAPNNHALVVEDDAGWQALLVELLTDAGFEADQGVSFIEALGKLRHHTYNLVVIDLMLASSLEPASNQDGYRLLGYTQKANIPTIIVSGYADPDDIERIYSEYPLVACLEKQAFDRKEFLETIQNIRQRSETGGEILSLTEREREVLKLLANGCTNKEIANDLCITTNTVKRHLKSLFTKLGVSTRAGASAIATRAGINL